MLFILAFVETSAQESNHIVFQDTEFIQSDSCLTNKTNFDKLKLNIIQDERLNQLQIQVEAGYKNLEFNSIESFNSFDFKFWLLSNDLFKSQSSFKIRIAYNISNSPVEEFFTKCLRYIDDAVQSDRGGSDSPDYVTLPVYFGTDRNYTASKNLNNAFGTERSELQYGLINVSVPHDHRIGELESPSIWRFEFSEDPSKHIMLQKISLLNKDSFFQKLSDAIKSSKKKRTFLFVHGYNTSFSEAAKRTAQISYDLKFDGKAVFYSWPSQASTFRYGKDEKNIAWSISNIKRFLKDYLSRSGAEEIYLVAHSMGNRGLTKAIVEVLKEQPNLKTKIKEIILAAPDIDADVFKNQIAPEMVSSSEKPITLYVSSDDLALKASKLIHGNARAGDAGDKLIVVDGIETIDATGIDTSFLSHSYFADTNSIISDIFDIIDSGKRALQRKRLILSTLKNENKIYWKVKQ